MMTRPNIYEQQAHNRRMTRLAVGAFLFFFAMVGAWFDFWTGSMSEARTTVPVFILPVLFTLTLYVAWSFWSTVHSRAWYHLDPDHNIEESLRRTERRWAVFLWLLFALTWYFTFIFLEYLDSPRSSLFKDVFVGNTFPWATLLSLAIGGTYAFVLYSRSRNLLTQVFNLEIPSPGEEEEKRFLTVIEEVSVAAGISPPEGALIRDNQPNAFSFGIHPMQSTVAVTSGLLHLLSRDELQGVVAHEIAHIRNRDARLMTIITALYGSVLLISDWSRLNLTTTGLLTRMRFPRFRGKGGPLVFFLTLGAMMVAPPAARLLALGISRQREYFADACAAELTRNPGALADALKKLVGPNVAAVAPYRAVAHMCIVDPLGRPASTRKGLLAEWFGTHPPVEKRTLLLNAMAYRFSSKNKSDAA
ncbi:MAG TPA: M48 family metalloprotease, partial [Bacteroidota bacterium]